MVLHLNQHHSSSKIRSWQPVGPPPSGLTSLSYLFSNDHQSFISKWKLTTAPSPLLKFLGSSPDANLNYLDKSFDDTDLVFLQPHLSLPSPENHQELLMFLKPTLAMLLFPNCYLRQCHLF